MPTDKYEVAFKKHMELLEEIKYDLDFRDLYSYHSDVWTTMAHAKYIPLKEMKTDHIVNSINMIERIGPTSCYGLGALWAYKLNDELTRRNNEE